MKVLTILLITACVSLATTVDVGYDEGAVTPFSC